MRSAASLSETSPRAGATTVSNAPPSTTMPSGGPRAGFHGWKRCSSGSISALPSGENPQIASSSMLARMHCGPARAKRVVTSSAPKKPSTTMRFDGQVRKPRIFETTKNIAPANSLFVVLARPRSGLGPEWLLALLIVAGARGFVGRIETWKLGAVLDFAHDPGFEALLLRPLLRHLPDQCRGDHYCAIGVGHDHIVGKHRHPAAADRLLPADESEAGDRSRRRHPSAPNRQFGAEYAGDIAHHAVGDERDHAALAHAGGQD